MVIKEKLADFQGTMISTSTTKRIPLQMNHVQSKTRTGPLFSFYFPVMRIFLENWNHSLLV